MNRRVTMIEEKHEDGLDLDAIQNTANLTAEDLVTNLKKFSYEIMAKTVSRNEVTILQEHVNLVERSTEKLQEKILLDEKVNDNIAELASIPAQMKSLKMEVLTHENSIS